MLRKTKIVCTLGPASDSEEMISKLMDAGMNVCRLNMSHGSYEEQGARIDHIKRLRAKLESLGPEGWEIKTIWGVGYKFELLQQ